MWSMSIEDKDIFLRGVKDGSNVVLKKPSLLGRFTYAFTKQPELDSAFQVSAGYLSGIRVSPKDRRVRHHFCIPLEEGLVRPSFINPNFLRRDVLSAAIKEGAGELRLSKHNIALLIPDVSQRAFVLNFESLPVTLPEREKVVYFRIKKLMPLLPEDIRLSYGVRPSVEGVKVLASLARRAVIQEFEETFAECHLRVRSAVPAFLGLLDLLPEELPDDILLVNIEKEAFSLLAYVGGEVNLFRQKSLGLEKRDERPVMAQVDNIMQEVDNTANFIEDREKRRIAALWVRCGLTEGSEEVFRALKERAKVAVESVSSWLPENLPIAAKTLMSPLVGQMS